MFPKSIGSNAMTGNPIKIFIEFTEHVYKIYVVED